MKKIRLLIAVAMVVLPSLTAVAQNRTLGLADIPFRFTAHGQTFEAGKYELRQIGAHAVRFQRVDTRAGVTLLSPQNIAKTAATKIVFRTDGERYDLTAIVAPSYAISLPKTESELAMSKLTTLDLQVEQ